MHRFTYANIVATLALAVALAGGTAYAAELAKNSVTSKQIAPGAVRTSDLGADAVTGAKVKESTLGPVRSVGGVRITPVDVAMDVNQADVVLYSTGGTVVKLTCASGTPGMVASVATAASPALAYTGLFGGSPVSSGFYTNTGSISTNLNTGAVRISVRQSATKVTLLEFDAFPDTIDGKACFFQGTREVLG